MTKSFKAAPERADAMDGTEAVTEFEQRLRGATLLTAEVLYYIPDHPKLLQTFTWQTLDVAPKYPRLNKFLDYWRREIEAVIHSVRVAQCDPLALPAWRTPSGVLRLH